MLEKQLTRVTGATNQNLNQSSDTSLVSFTAHKPIEIRRFGVVADASQGLLAAMRLKMRTTPVATGTTADISGAGTLNPGGAIARGNGVYKDTEESVQINAGDEVEVAIDTAAGGTSTGDVFIEYAELPFAGELIDNMSESA